MKLQLKRFATLSLAIYMVISLLPMAAFAATAEASGDLDGLFTELPEGWSFTSQVGSAGYGTGKEGGEWKKSDIKHNGNTVWESVSELSDTPNAATASWITPSNTDKEYYVSFEYAFFKGADSTAEFSFGQSSNNRLNSLSNKGTPMEDVTGPEELESVTWQTANVAVPAGRGIGLLHKLNGAAGGREKVYVSNFKVYDELPQEWKATVKVTVTTDHLDLSNFTYVTGGNGNIQIKEDTQFPITLETTVDKTVTVGLVKLKQYVDFINWETNIPEGEWTSTDSSGFSWKVSKGGTYYITLRTEKHAPATLPGTIQLLKQEGDAWDPVQIKGCGNQTVTSLPSDAFSNYWWYDWTCGTDNGQKLRLQYSGTAENTEVKLYDDEKPVEVQVGEDGASYYEIAPNDTEHLLKMVVTSSEEGSVESAVTLLLWPTMTWEQAFGEQIEDLIVTEGNSARTLRRKPDALARLESLTLLTDTLSFEFNSKLPETIEIEGEQKPIRDESHQNIFTSQVFDKVISIDREVRFTAKKPGIISFDYLVTDGASLYSKYQVKDAEIYQYTNDLTVNSTNDGRENVYWTHHEYIIPAVGDSYYFESLPSKPDGFAAITNLKFLSEPKSITFSQEGADGTISVPEGSTFYVGQTLDLVASPADTSVFLGWYDGEGKLLTLSITYSLQIKSSTPGTITAKFGEKADNVAQIGTTLYTTLDDALSAAASGVDKTVKIVAKDLKIEKDTAIPAGVTVVLPCSASDMGYLVGDGINRSPDGTALSPATGKNITNTYCILTVADGRTLTIKGTLLVNAEVGRPGGGHYDQDVNGGCAVVQLSPGSKIVVESGGLLDVFGYVKGTGTVTVKSGGTASDLYVVRNWRGGSQAFAIYPLVYPMNQEDMHNIEVETVVENGGRLEGSVRMYAGGYFSYTRFPQDDGTNGLIRGGTVTKTLTPKGEKYESREKIVLNGTGNISYSALMIVGLEMSTGDFLFPIDGDMDFEVNGTWTITDQLKFMPGAIVTLKDSANVTISEKTQRSIDKNQDGPSEPIQGNNVVFYDTTFIDTMKAQMADTNYPTEKRGDAKLVMEGGTTLTANGAFAGKIEIAESATETHPAVVTFNGGVEVKSKEANDYCKIGGASNPNPIRDLTFTAVIDGCTVESGKTYTCWKEGGVTVIKAAEDGKETNSVTYNGDAQKWADDSAAYEYKAADGPWAGEAKNAGEYSVRKVTSSGSGYKLVEVLGTLTVKPIVAKFALDNASLTYTGAEQTVTATVTNKVDGEDVTAILTGDTGTDADSYTAKVTGITGEGAENYTIDGATVELPWTIGKAQLTLTWGEQTEFTYTGSEQSVTATLSGQLNGDALTVTLSGDKNTDVGNYQATAVIKGDKLGNYEKPENLTLEWSITKAPAPGITFPTVTEEVTYDPNGKLENVKLTGGSEEYGTFEWAEPNTVPEVGKSYTVTFTPSKKSKQNYEEITQLTAQVDANVIKGGQDAPVYVTATQPDHIDGKGSITGVTTNMEYQKDGDGDTWKDVTDTTIPDLDPGTYKVRYKENSNQNASPATEVTINEFSPDQEITPSAAIDFKAEKLTGLTAGGEYKINEQNVTADGEGKIDIDEDWIGTTVSVVRKGDGVKTEDSESQSLPIPNRPAAPEGLTGGYTSAPEGSDGKVTGLTNAEYEYKASDVWQPLTAETELAAGTYQVRLAATDTAFYGEETTVTITDPTVEKTPAITIDYKAEQLTGFEDGTYTVNGTQITVTDKKADIDPDWFGATVEIVKKGTSPTSIDSEAQSLEIPARPAAPGVTVRRVSEAGKDNGGFTVTDPTEGSAYEYKKGESGAWTDLEGTKAENLSEGTYYVRVKAADNTFAGETVSAVVTLKDGQAAPSLTVTQAAAIGETGSVTGLTVAMEWSEQENGVYVPFTEDKIAELAKVEGSLHIWVRLSETEDLAHSPAVEVNIRKFVPETMETPTDISIDYTNETLTNLTEGAYKVTVDGQESTVTVTGTDCAIKEGWFGRQVTVTKSGDGKTSVDGASVTLDIPARPEAPTASSTQAGSATASDGTIIVTVEDGKAYEYRKFGENSWNTVPEGGKVEDLASGNYEVRVKAGESSFASEAASVEVKAYVAPSNPGTPGSKTETVTNPDGSTTTTTTEADGTRTETTTQTDGTVTEKVTYPDGSAVETTTTSDGVTGQVTTDAQGEITAVEVVIPESKDGETVTAPVEVPAAKSTDEAPEISVRTGSEDTTRVEIPVTEFGPGTVAVVVHEDGTEEIVRDCVLGENGVVLNIEGDVTLKIVDNTKTFKDVEPANHWATEEVEFVAARQLFNGTGEDVFSPDGNMTRGMLVTVLHRLAYEPDAAAAGFGDVDAGRYYAEAVSWAAGLGVVNGKSDDLFAPEEDITREDLAVILYRYAGKMGYRLTRDGKYSAFTDANDINGYAQEAMDWAVSVGLISGRGDRLAPKETATRAEVAAIFMRFCENVIK